MSQRDDADPKEALEPTHPEARKLGARVAHEINNPAAYVLSNLEFLREVIADLEVSGEIDDNRIRALVSAIDDALDGIMRIRNIIRQLGAVPAEPPELPHAVPTSAFMPRRRCRVLIVDDEAPILKALKRLLSSKHDVVGVERAELGLELLAKGEEFDVVLCDLLLPTLTGMDFHDQVAALYPAMLPRLVFMTGGAVTARAARFISETARHTLAKPIDTDTLHEIIVAIVGENQARSKTSSNGGD